MVPVLSRAHTVDAPNPAVNSWTPYSSVWLATEVDQVKVTVEEPVEVTLPYQISSSAPTEPANCTPLVQVVTPPPDTAVRVPAARWAKTTSTSPTFCGDTARVLRPVPTLEVKLPTAAMLPGVT